MTEEIIIDGVYVAKCRYFTSEWEDGIYECYIEIPWWIAQNIELDYHVNITPANGFFQYYVSERDPYYFIVRSDKDSMGFTFELVATLLERNTTDNNAIIANNSVITDTSTDEVTPFQMPNNNQIYSNDIIKGNNQEDGE